MKAVLENYSVFMVKADIFSLLLFILYHSSLYATVHYLSLYLNFALTYIQLHTDLCQFDNDCVTLMLYVEHE